MDYVYRAGELYANEDLTGCIGLKDSAHAPVFPGIRMILRLFAAIPFKRLRSFLHFANQISRSNEQYAKQRHLDALMVCVDREHQGKGIASELIRFAKCKADELEIPLLFDTDMKDYADMYYETLYGQNTDGIVVLLVLNNGKGKRDIYISTSGKCIKQLSDSEREDIFDVALDKHSPDSKGYYDFLNYIAVGIKGAVIPHVKWYMLPLAFIIAFAIAMLILSFMKKQLKSVEMQRGAVNYVRPGSMNVISSRDSYLYSTVSRTARPKDSGSSSHTSSGGGSHGGGGRSF